METESVTIIGCGGLGSNMGMGITRMNSTGTTSHPLTLIDGDIFHKHNLFNQNSFEKSVGRNKAVDVAESLQLIRPNIIVHAFPHFIPHKSCPHDVVKGVAIIAVDSMLERRKIMEDCIFDNPNVKAVIELRMDANTGISHYFDPNNEIHRQCWGLYWHPDNEAEHTKGCGGDQPVVSAIFGTISLGLRQFEHQLVHGNPNGANNRLYQDFERNIVTPDSWPFA